MTPARFLRLARRAVYGTAAVAATYLFWRYDLVHLPAGGCSPLWSVPTGRNLLVDAHGGLPRHGDVVFYLDPAGEVRLGQVTAPLAGVEPSRPDDVWVEGDRADCPTVDSREFGFLPAERVVGRLLVVLPW